MTRSHRRIRTRGELTPAPVSSHRISRDGGGNIVVNATNSYPNGLEEGEYEEMVDRVVPRFRERVASGEIINNSMTKRKMSYSFIPSDYIYHRVSDGYETTFSPWTGVWSANRCGRPKHQDVAVDLSRLRVLAGTSARAGVQEPTWQSGEFLAEVSRTATILVDPIKSFQKLLRRVHRDAWHKKGKLRQGANLSEYLADNWLYYRYGVRPVVQDIDAAGQAVANKLADLSTLSRLTSRGYAEDSDTVEFSHNHGEGHVREGTTTVVAKVRAGILYEQLQRPSEFGLTWRELPVTAWNLLPYSFVVDWFVNVGEFIQAIRPFWGVTVLASWTTTEVVRETHSEAYVDTISSGWAIDRDGRAIEHMLDETKTRTTGTTVGLARKRVLHSGWDGVKRVADASSLVTQLLSRKAGSVR